MNAAIDRTLKKYRTAYDYTKETERQLIYDIYNNVSVSVDDNVTKDYINNRLLKILRYQHQLEELKKIPVIEQRSEEWYKARQTLISASDFGQALNRGEYGNQRDFIIKKVENKSKEIKYKKPLLWGVKYEDVATAIYSKRNNVKIYEFGLIKHSELDYIGASPDGISDLGIMLEIKCPYSRKISGKIIEQYYDQIQGQLEVCDLDECDFLECEFEEYKDEEKFINNKDELKEKGIIIQYRENEDDEFKYLYSSLNDDMENIIKWKNNTIEEFDVTIDFKVDYWKIRKYNCQRVYRDKELFEKMKNDLKFIWDKILYFRHNNSQYLKEILNNKKTKIYNFKTKENEVVLNGFAIRNIENDY